MNTAPTVDLNGDYSICEGETHILDAKNNGLNYLWSTGAKTQQIKISNTGVYSVNVTNTKNCVGTDSIKLTVNPLPIVDITIPENVCIENGSVQLSGSPLGGQFSGNGVNGSLFNPQDASLSIDLASKIHYTYTSIHNCTTKDSNNITVRKEPSIKLKTTKFTICVEDSVELTATSDDAISFEWYTINNSLLVNSSSVYLYQEGNYYVKAKNEYCSTISETITVDVIEPQIEAEVNPKESISLGEYTTVSIVNPQPDYIYEWSNSSDNKQVIGSAWSVNPLVDTEYFVEGNIGNCSVSTSVTGYVYLPIDIPNAFTPNGDGINDTWHIEGLESYPNAIVKVFNRWGALIYIEYEAKGLWDGLSKNGEMVPNSTYYYVIELNDSQKRKFSGDVSIIR